MAGFFEIPTTKQYDKILLCIYGKIYGKISIRQFDSSNSNFNFQRASWSWFGLMETNRTVNESHYESCYKSYYVFMGRFFKNCITK